MLVSKKLFYLSPMLWKKMSMCWIQIYSTLLSSNAFLETFAGFSNRIQRRLCIRRFFKGVLNTKEVSHNHSGLEILWTSNCLFVSKVQHSISLHKNPKVIFEWLTFSCCPWSLFSWCNGLSPVTLFPYLWSSYGLLSWHFCKLHHTFHREKAGWTSWGLGFFAWRVSTKLSEFLDGNCEVVPNNCT